MRVTTVQLCVGGDSPPIAFIETTADVHDQMLRLSKAEAQLLSESVRNRCAAGLGVVVPRGDGWVWYWDRPRPWPVTPAAPKLSELQALLMMLDAWM